MSLLISAGFIVESLGGSEFQFREKRGRQRAAS
jgi:hypothetical protein